MGQPFSCYTDAQANALYRALKASCWCCWGPRSSSIRRRTGFLDILRRRWPVTTQGCCDSSPVKISLVEARGVEPLSEDRQRTASTCVADSLSFAATHAHRQA